MKSRIPVIRLLILGTAIWAGAGFAAWVPLPPVGNGYQVGPGGCAARGRGYTFVAIGDEDYSIFPFEHATETWNEDFEDIFLTGLDTGNGQVISSRYQPQRTFSSR
jgi:hypothetical protein